jgi:hypothetical protein
MKLILIAAAFLFAAPSFADESPAPNPLAVCSAEVIHVVGESTYVVGPMLGLGKNEYERTYVPIRQLGAYTGATFGDNLCQLCQWGVRGGNVQLISQEYVGDIAAFVDSDGKLQRIGRSQPNQGNLQVDSLTCTN